MAPARSTTLVEPQLVELKLVSAFNVPPGRADREPNRWNADARGSSRGGKGCGSKERGARAGGMREARPLGGEADLERVGVLLYMECPGPRSRGNESLKARVLGSARARRLHHGKPMAQSCRRMAQSRMPGGGVA
eukprot:3707512-Pleurochrysis_carterae.AAC.1